MLVAKYENRKTTIVHKGIYIIGGIYSTLNFDSNCNPKT